MRIRNIVAVIVNANCVKLKNPKKRFLTASSEESRNTRQMRVEERYSHIFMHIHINKHVQLHCTLEKRMRNLDVLNENNELKTVKCVHKSHNTATNMPPGTRNTYRHVCRCNYAIGCCISHNAFLKCKLNANVKYISTFVFFVSLFVYLYALHAISQLKLPH